MGFFDFPEDPQKQALLMMGLGLLQGAPNSRKNFGADFANAGLLGVTAFNQGQRTQMQKAEEAQQREMRAMQMEQMKQQQARQQQIQGLAPQFFSGGHPGVEERGVPPTPPKADFAGYAQALGGIDPMAAMQIQQALRKEAPKVHALSEGQVLMDETGREVGRGQPKREGPQKGAIREVKTGGQVFTYEWDGQEWKKIAAAPQFKPDAPEKPPQPQLYEGPNGPMWISPPARGAGPMPVTGPDGKPVASNKNQPSEAELTAAGYGGRMQAAEQIVGQVGEKGLPSTGTVMASVLPVGPAGQRFAERQVMSPPQQQYRQAQEDWVRAKLRKESGAVIAEDEMKREIETYFPQYGDSKEVIAQKAKARQVAMRAMSTAAGKAGGRVSEVSGWSIRPLP